ncbi:MAG: hypothetical protein WDO15_09760 [Bacteroidota bacterium]
MGWCGSAVLFNVVFDVFHSEPSAIAVDQSHTQLAIPSDAAAFVAIDVGL